MASRRGGEEDPVANAAGWRVTRRVAPSRESEIGASGRPRPAAAKVGPSGPQTLPGQLGVPARAPRRVGPPQRRGRGISFLALAAAAVVVVFVLGLAVLDMRTPEWPQAWPERPAMNGKSGHNPGEAPAARPG